MNIDNRSQQQKWTADLCSCGDDVGTCCITCFLPCITFGQIAEMLDEGSTSCVAGAVVYGLCFVIQCHWLYSCTYREKLRAKFGLPSDPCCDCCVHCCCEACALCQEHAELKNRGLDPSKGWIGPPNSMPPNAMPPMPPSMYR